MSERGGSAGRVFGGLLFAAAAVGAVGSAALLKNGFRDDHGNFNASAGPINIGDCAKLLDRPETRDPATDAQLIAVIQNIGRVCGYCSDEYEVNVSGAPYEVCIDPETIAFDYTQTVDGTPVAGYMMTVPESPEGYLYTALDTNPGFCAALIDDLEGSMRDMFSRAFVPEIATDLVPFVRIAPGSNSACEALPSPTTTWVP